MHLVLEKINVFCGLFGRGDRIARNGTLCTKSCKTIDKFNIIVNRPTPLIVPLFSAFVFRVCQTIITCSIFSCLHLPSGGILESLVTPP